MEFPASRQSRRSPVPSEPLSVLGRAVAFVLPAGLGLAIVAGVVLLPAYARLAEVRHERDPNG